MLMRTLLAAIATASLFSGPALAERDADEELTSKTLQMGPVPRGFGGGGGSAGPSFTGGGAPSVVTGTTTIRGNVPLAGPPTIGAVSVVHVPGSQNASLYVIYGPNGFPFRFGRSGDHDIAVDIQALRDAVTPK